MDGSLSDRMDVKGKQLKCQEIWAKTEDCKKWSEIRISSDFTLFSIPWFMLSEALCKAWLEILAREQYFQGLKRCENLASTQVWGQDAVIVLLSLTSFRSAINKNQRAEEFLKENWWRWGLISLKCEKAGTEGCERRNNWEYEDQVMGIAISLLSSPLLERGSPVPTLPSCSQKLSCLSLLFWVGEKQGKNDLPLLPLSV